MGEAGIDIEISEENQVLEGILSVSLRGEGRVKDKFFDLMDTHLTLLAVDELLEDRHPVS